MLNRRKRLSEAPRRGHLHNGRPSKPFLAEPVGEAFGDSYKPDSTFLMMVCSLILVLKLWISCWTNLRQSRSYILHQIWRIAVRYKVLFHLFDRSSSSSKMQNRPIDREMRWLWSLWSKNHDTAVLNRSSERGSMSCRWRITNFAVWPKNTTCLCRRIEVWRLRCCFCSIN